jgi:hypothetical protein
MADATNYAWIYGTNAWLGKSVGMATLEDISFSQNCTYDIEDDILVSNTSLQT